MGALLTESSVLMCPHAGTVDVITSDTRATAQHGAVLLATDTFVVDGCGLEDSPCVSVVWLRLFPRSKALGSATLTKDSLGLCVGAAGIQGLVQVVDVQPRVVGE
jgi:hypothetical protein